MGKEAENKRNCIRACNTVQPLCNKCATEDRIDEEDADDAEYAGDDDGDDDEAWTQTVKL